MTGRGGFSKGRQEVTGCVTGDERGEAGEKENEGRRLTKQREKSRKRIKIEKERERDVNDPSARERERERY